MEKVPTMKEFSSGRKRLLIIAGYAAALGLAWLFTALRYAALPASVLQQSGGMAAFGQLIWFLALAGFFSLAPTYFLLKELREAGWLWKPLAAFGAFIALTALAAEAYVAAAFLGGGFRYVYPDPAFFNLSWLAWLHYKAPLPWRFILSPVPLAGILCAYFAAPKGGARKLLGWAALAEFSASLLGALLVFLMISDSLLRP